MKKQGILSAFFAVSMIGGTLTLTSVKAATVGIEQLTLVEENVAAATLADNFSSHHGGHGGGHHHGGHHHGGHHHGGHHHGGHHHGGHHHGGHHHGGHHHHFWGTNASNSTTTLPNVNVDLSSNS